MLELTLLVFCALAAVVGVVVITVGSYASLSVFYTPWIAGFIVGSVIIALSVIGALAVWFATRPPISEPPRKYASSMPPPQNTQIDAVAHIGEHIGESLNNGRIKTVDVIIAALVAGTVLGASPALRRRLLQHKIRSDNTTQENSR